MKHAYGVVATVDSDGALEFAQTFVRVDENDFVYDCAQTWRTSKKTYEANRVVYARARASQLQADVLHVVAAHTFHLEISATLQATRAGVVAVLMRHGAESWLKTEIARCPPDEILAVARRALERELGETVAATPGNAPEPGWLV